MCALKLYDILQLKSIARHLQFIHLQQVRSSNVIDSLDANLSVIGGIYISCNIFMAAVQMMGVCWGVTPCT
jgi:hypothetical protein